MLGPFAATGLALTPGADTSSGGNAVYVFALPQWNESARPSMAFFRVLATVFAVSPAVHTVRIPLGQREV